MREVLTAVKMTMMFRDTANPRRTTLSHVEDPGQLESAGLPEHAVELPARTANPRRTVLMDIPAG